MTIPAAHHWRTNAHLIADVAQLPHLNDTDTVVDATYGRGRFWSIWRPANLIAHDLDPAKGDGVDFRHLPEADRSVDVVVLDPDYRLNGKPDRGDFDNRYGIHVAKRWQDRVADALAGIPEAARVLRPGGRLLYKTQDQVVSGRVRWLTDEATRAAEKIGLEKIDEFLMLTAQRAQPPGRRQVHAHQRPSVLLVYRRSLHA